MRFGISPGGLRLGLLPHNGGLACPGILQAVADSDAFLKIASSCPARSGAGSDDVASQLQRLVTAHAARPNHSVTSQV
jgi:hypothetical protein